jgi:hypothetical protein
MPCWNAFWLEKRESHAAEGCVDTYSMKTAHRLCRQTLFHMIASRQPISRYHSANALICSTRPWHRDSRCLDVSSPYKFRRHTCLSYNSGLSCPLQLLLLRLTHVHHHSLVLATSRFPSPPIPPHTSASSAPVSALHQACLPGAEQTGSGKASTSSVSHRLKLSQRIQLLFGSSTLSGCVTHWLRNQMPRTMRLPR